jgi:hypothetical protein
LQRATLTSQRVIKCGCSNTLKTSEAASSKGVRWMRWKYKAMTRTGESGPCDVTGYGESGPCDVTGYGESVHVM